MADWSVLPRGTKVQVFNDAVTGEDALAKRLKDFEVIALMRERTPFGKELLERLPKLRLLVTIRTAKRIDRP